MRILQAERITDAVRTLCTEANYNLPHDMECALSDAAQTDVQGKALLEKILQNASIAREEQVPICQDTGMAVFFVTIGREVHIDGDIDAAITEGVRRGYTEGYLRASVVSDPLRRTNTGDNTPPIIHYSFADGDKITITIAPKGFGSENKSALKMLTPADGRDGVVQFVVDTVQKAGGSPCPPIVIGIGIGGTMEKAAILSKYALTRPVGSTNPDPYYAALEQDIKAAVNNLGIGALGLGGPTTALGVHAEYYPTHIAGLPVAVNISCHVTRHQTVIL